MKPSYENSVTGQNRVVRKKGDLNGAGKGDWLRINLVDEQYKKNYDKIFFHQFDVLLNYYLTKVERLIFYIQESF